MKEIRVREANPGMVLAKPVLDKMGRALLKRGEQLSQPLISRLDTWGVSHVTVEADEEPDQERGPRDPMSESQILESLDARLSEQFDRHKHDPRMGVIRDSAKRALLKKRTGKK